MHGTLDLILTGDFCIDQSRYRSGNANTNQNHYFSIYCCCLRFWSVTHYWLFPRNIASFRDNIWVQRLTVSLWVFSWYLITAKSEHEHRVFVSSVDISISTHNVISVIRFPSHPILLFSLSVYWLSEQQQRKLSLCQNFVIKK